MSKGPHNKITIPHHWWKQLEMECQKRGFRTVEALCNDSPGVISARTIKDAFKRRKMTEKSFGDLATLLGYKTSSDLIEAWRKAAGPKSGTKQPISGNTKHALDPSFPLFRDIQLKRYQEIPLEERPHPWPHIIGNRAPPFPPK